jgi:hypothetical protein
MSQLSQAAMSQLSDKQQCHNCQTSSNVTIIRQAAMSQISGYVTNISQAAMSQISIKQLCHKYQSSSYVTNISQAAMSQISVK